MNMPLPIVTGVYHHYNWRTTAIIFVMFFRYESEGREVALEATKGIDIGHLLPQCEYVILKI